MIVNKKIPNFLLISIVPQKMTDDEAYIDIKELVSLVEAQSGIVREIVIQKRELNEKGLYIGKGKIEEVKEIIINKKIDVVILNSIVKPGQIFEITQILELAKRGIQVWDRVDLILKIFSQHAVTAEAKLQIELAIMRHMGPRIYGMGYILSQQGGGIGTRGIGETNTELMKRHWRSAIHEVGKKLEKLHSDRQRQIDHRKRVGLKTISIVGYTNAGKTSLFNLLSGKENIVKNSLFVTLDASVAKISLPNFPTQVLLSDTIGFIKNLPPDLIEAFKSTLLESINADILLHVIDVTDKDMERKIYAVEEIMKELGVIDKKNIYVFNKTDDWDEINHDYILNKYQNFYPMFISVKQVEGIDDLKEKIESVLIDIDNQK